MLYGFDDLGRRYVWFDLSNVRKIECKSLFPVVKDFKEKLSLFWPETVSYNEVLDALLCKPGSLLDIRKFRCNLVRILF